MTAKWKVVAFGKGRRRHTERRLGPNTAGSVVKYLAGEGIDGAGDVELIVLVREPAATLGGRKRPPAAGDPSDRRKPAMRGD